MQCRLWQLALFLVVGAVINYALAMGFIWFSRVFESFEEVYRFEDTGYFRQESLGLTHLRWAPVRWDEDGFELEPPPAWSRLWSEPIEEPPPRRMALFTDVGWKSEFAAGWPRRAMAYECEVRLVGGKVYEWMIHDAIELLKRGDGRPRAVPLRIIPVGFAFNTVLFAALVGVMWHTPPAIRRYRRKRGNRCPKCGYLREGLGDEAACPECGTSSAAAVPAS